VPSNPYAQVQLLDEQERFLYVPRRRPFPARGRVAAGGMREAAARGGVGVGTGSEAEAVVHGSERLEPHVEQHGAGGALREAGVDGARAPRPAAAEVG
jgi:hypothetical protein